MDRTDPLFGLFRYWTSSKSQLATKVQGGTGDHFCVSLSLINVGSKQTVDNGYDLFDIWELPKFDEGSLIYGKIQTMYNYSKAIE